MEELDFEIAFFEALTKQKPNFVDALIPLAEAYTKRGLYQKGLEIDQRLAKLCPEDELVYYNLTCSYALIGNLSEAFKALEKSLDLGYSDIDHLLCDEDLKLLRDDPRFLDLVEKIKAKRKHP